MLNYSIGILGCLVRNTTYCVDILPLFILHTISIVRQRKAKKIGITGILEYEQLIAGEIYDILMQKFSIMTGRWPEEDVKYG